MGRRRTRTRIGTSRIGRRGPSYLFDKDHLTLARLLVALEHMVGRLTAELDGREWKDPEKVVRSNMRGIDRGRSVDGAKRMRAVERAIIHFALKRNDPDHETFRKRVAKEYGGTFSTATLYREPYLSAWAPHLSRPDAPEDTSALMKDRRRWSRRAMIQAIMKHNEALKALGVDVSDKLLADDGEDWSPLPASPGR
ncbi:hypothetical protein [Sphingomonas sp.]|uniref:hypothetical protein n=1 Tax=Sphingomonas sp. TaxID=28214 RepID=UPI002DD6AA24|nr:hypothetical protein [Sphingomonas sp.]